jgi:hypothetical protein
MRLSSAGVSLNLHEGQCRRECADLLAFCRSGFGLIVCLRHPEQDASDFGVLSPIPHHQHVQKDGGDRGLFIYEVDDSLAERGVQVLAKAVSLEAAFRLIDLWRNRSEAGPLLAAT